MTGQVENLILEYLRAMRGNIAIIRDDIRELKLRMTSLETHLANLFGDVVRTNARIDRIDERLGRVEHRLEMIP